MTSIGQGSEAPALFSGKGYTTLPGDPRSSEHIGNPPSQLDRRNQGSGHQQSRSQTGNGSYPPLHPQTHIPPTSHHHHAQSAPFPQSLPLHPHPRIAQLSSYALAAVSVGASVPGLVSPASYLAGHPPPSSTISSTIPSIANPLSPIAGPMAPHYNPVAALHSLPLSSLVSVPGPRTNSSTLHSIPPQPFPPPSPYAPSGVASGIEPLRPTPPSTHTTAIVPSSTSELFTARRHLCLRSNYSSLLGTGSGTSINDITGGAGNVNVAGVGMGPYLSTERTAQTAIHPWRQTCRLRTTNIVLVMCLNLNFLPPDGSRPMNCKNMQVCSSS